MACVSTAQTGPARVWSTWPRVPEVGARGSEQGAASGKGLNWQRVEEGMVVKWP